MRFPARGEDRAGNAAGSIRERRGGAPLGGARALQHRRRRVRPPSAREARDDPRALLRRRARGAAGASCRTSPTSCANVLAALGVERGDRVAVVLPPTPGDGGACSSPRGSSARCCCRCRCSTATRASATGSATPSRACSSPTRPTRRASRRRHRPQLLVLDEDTLAGASREFETVRHARGRPGAALLHLRHDRPGEGHRARPPLHPRPRGVPLLPRRPGRRALPRHGRVGVGGRHLPAARPVAARRGAVRLPARGRLRPAPASSTSSRATR